VARVKAGDHVVLSTRYGDRFDECGCGRWVGRPTASKGIDLSQGDEVIGMIVASGGDGPANLLTVAPGYGERTLLTGTGPESGRKGVIDIQTSEPLVWSSPSPRSPTTTSHAHHQRRHGHRTRVGTMRTIDRNTRVSVDQSSTRRYCQQPGQASQDGSDVGELEPLGPDGQLIRPAPKSAMVTKAPFLQSTVLTSSTRRR
jgi:hypothetical protein